MCSKSGVMDHKKFDSKNFSTVNTYVLEYALTEKGILKCIGN